LALKEGTKEETKEETREEAKEEGMQRLEEETAGSEGIVN